MRKLAIALLATALYFPAYTCTTFFINKDGQMVFGRNYDWITGNGMVCTNQRAMAKESANTSDGKTISWISLYSSITFNQYGKEFPTGGMNEKGLVVELMWLDGTQYAAADNRPALGVLQWIQYQLDNCAAVDELIATDKKIRIASKGGPPLHYLVADATGNAATIEFLEGKMVVHKGKELPFPVLTNNTYTSCINQAGVAISSPDVKEVSFTDNSIDRFARAGYMVKQFQQTEMAVPIIDYSFSILDKVAQGTHTKWSIVYDISHKQIFFKSNGFTSVKNIAFADFNFSCYLPSKAWDINQAPAGHIASLFGDYSEELNRKTVEKSMDESSSQIPANEDETRQLWQYPAKNSCTKQKN